MNRQPPWLLVQGLSPISAAAPSAVRRLGIRSVPLHVRFADAPTPTRCGADSDSVEVHQADTVHHLRYLSC